MSNFVNVEVVKSRYDICKKCEFFVQFTKECSKNKEFLEKYLLKDDSECPTNQWN